MLLFEFSDLPREDLGIFISLAADFIQRREMFLRLGQIVGQQIRFADVLVRAAVVRIHFQCVLVVVKSLVEIAEMAACVTEVVVNVGTGPQFIQ